MLTIGWLSLNKLPVDQFPDITLPIVRVNTPYPGAGPSEIETLVSKPIEEELLSISGMKSLRSVNREGLSTIIAEFTLETDIKYAEQQVRDRVSTAKTKLPKEIKEPNIRRIDPSDQPIMIISVAGDLSEAKLFDLVDDKIKTKLEQVAQVGLVEILGGRKREIRVELDRDKLRAHEVSASLVASRIGAAGQNIPLGKVDKAGVQTVFRTLAEFHSLSDVSETIANFMGNDVPITVGKLGTVIDDLEDESSRTFLNGSKSIFLNVFRQSGANTIAVTDAVKVKVAMLNQLMANSPGKPKITVVRDGSRVIRANVDDVKESIIIGIILTIIVVFFFLGNWKSTFITGLALPNSLLGAFILMAVAGFTVNVMTLLALSLAVGLLVDDAIVVRENIFRHMEMGKPARQAALEGTAEVMLAVVATTFVVIAVFGPIGFLKGVVGQFFKQFGLTICFAMLISLFDAVTIAPMLSTYLAGRIHEKKKPNFIYQMTLGNAVQAFDRFQSWLEKVYGGLLRFALRWPLLIVTGALAVFFCSFIALKFVPKTFLPPQDFGEFMVSIELPPGSSLSATTDVALKIDNILRAHPEVVTSLLIVGNQEGETNNAQFFVNMVPPHERSMNTSKFKEIIRGELKPFASVRPQVKDIDMVMGGMRPFTVNISGNDFPQIEKYANALTEHLKKNPALIDPDTNYRGGKPEFQVKLDNVRAFNLGVSGVGLGTELATQVEGALPAKFRENDREYDVRVRMKESERDLKKGFNDIMVPNINGSIVRLPSVAKAIEATGPSNINRQDRSRYIQVSADIAPGGPGMAFAMEDVKKFLEQDMKLPPEMSYRFVGQAENFQELIGNMLAAAGLGVLFIYLVLSSLYESFIVPLSIMMVLPLAACGAFYGLFITQHSFDIFSMIGAILLMGLASKNSILLVDYTRQLQAEGVPLKDALVRAGQTRLRPILMTTFALIAGMLPVAIGLNEASKQRTSMGVSVIGGLISSTLLSLLVIPIVYAYIERARNWVASKFFTKRASEEASYVGDGHLHAK